jgi:hypothetical protein
MRSVPALAVLLLASTLTAQIGYISGFETLTATPGGTPAAGQDGYYIPPVASTFDGAFYTYAGNTIGVPVNPNGGSVFYAGIGVSGLCRSQRNVTPPTNSLMVIQFDFLCNYTGTGTPVNNIGGFSLQPSAAIPPQFPNAAVYSNLIFTWPATPTTPLTWGVSYSAGPTLAGVVTAIPDPAFQNLAVNTWYTIGCTLDLRTQVYVNFFIVNGATRTTYTPSPAVAMANQGSTQMPTDFRLFTGNIGNLDAFDNVKITFGATNDVFGTGCAGAMGIPTLAAGAGSSPTLGTTFTAAYGNLPNSVVVNMVGFSNTLALGVFALPYDLTPNGFPGCSLLVDPLVTQLIIGSANAANWTLAIPSNTSYLGAELFNQGASLQTPSPGLAFSNGLRSVVGL